MRITVETVPQARQRYATVGDWLIDAAGNIAIRVSEMGNWRYEALVAFHEIAEALLCADRGITTEAVDAFDMEYERRRPEGDVSEPGDHPDCPCRKEHFFATTVERMLCAELGVDWAEYERTVEAL